MRHATASELIALLRSAEMLGEQGMSDRQIAAAVESRLLHRVRRGWYMDRSHWDALWPESQHRAHLLAVASDTRGATVVFAGVSAAVAHHLPLYRMRPARVHVMCARHRRHSVSDVMRHEGPLPDSDVVEVDGVFCTSLSRTVSDVLRSVRPETALALADAALAKIGGDPRRFDADAAAEWAAGVEERLAIPGLRGVRPARKVFAFADGRAQRPLESVSRLQLHRLGFRQIELQIPVPAPGGGDYYVDLGMPGARAFGECDGKQKYLDEAMRSGRSLEEVLLEEKQREDWIRGSTQRRLGRWGDEHASTPERLGARLRSFGIHPA